MPKAKVTSKGQVTIPAIVRKDLGLKSGSLISFEPVISGYEIRVIAEDSLDELPNLFTYDGPVISIENMDEIVRTGAIDSYLEGQQL